jgi:predicted nuclease with RNAse H fold
VLTVGVDLAAEPAGTAIAALEWSGAGARLVEVVLPGDDDAVVKAVLRADKAGIDCPLGWPDEFVAFVSGHRLGAAAYDAALTGRAGRRRVAWRHTDEVVRAVTGVPPLSVAADLIAHAAFRCASLQARIAELGAPVDRSGAGTVVEVYPAASLKLWGLPSRGYKRPKNRAVLGVLVDRLAELVPWLDLGGHEQLCRRSDHVLDAVVAALTARAVARGQASRPDRHELAAARTEGWIALPTGPLSALRDC